MGRVIFHLDMDAFYAAIEQRDDPSLAGKPVIVGSPPTQRGVVCAASYEARKFGVRSAMPSVTAGRLCPRGVFVTPQMDKYRAESGLIMDLVASIGGLVEQVSIDEAYVDLSAILGGGDEAHVSADDALLRALPVGRQLKERIRGERRLTATVGIASNKFLAKVASDFQKPDGLTLIPDRDKVAFLRPMPVGVIHGVGKVTADVLGRVGILTVGDLQDYSGDLRSMVGSFGERLKNLAAGIDDRPVEVGDEVKSISSEETFLHDTADRPILRRCLREQAEQIAAKLKRRHLDAQTVQVKVRYSDFTTLTRQVTVEEPLAEAAQIYRLGCFLLGRERLVSRPLRLLGLGVSTLRETSWRQLPLL